MSKNIIYHLNRFVPRKGKIGKQYGNKGESINIMSVKKETKVGKILEINLDIPLYLTLYSIILKLTNQINWNWRWIFIIFGSEVLISIIAAFITKKKIKVKVR